MKKLLATTTIVALALALGACTSSQADPTVEDLGSTASELALDAQSLVNDADLGAELNNAVTVVANNATTVRLAAAGGDVSAEDVDALRGSLDGLEHEIEAARDSLEPAVQDRLDDLAAKLRDAVAQLETS